MKRGKIFLVAILGIIFFIGCGKKKEENKSGILNYASTKDIRDLNPHMYSGEMAAQNMIFESLVINTADGIKPALAKSWEISDDGLEYTFNLRKGVKFSDGEIFDAYAVKANMDAIVSNKERHAWLDMVNEIQENKVIDDYTFKLILKHPYYPTLVELGLTRPFRFISPKSFKDGETKNGVLNYSGTGPWILTEHKENQYSVFTANTNYWGEKPKIETLVWKVMPDHQTILLALQKGEIDLLFGSDGDMIDLDSFDALQRSGKYIATMSEPIASRAILLNTAKSILNELSIRKAFQYAINKTDINEGILNSSETVANTLLSKNVPYSDIDLEIRNYNQDIAKNILENLEWKVSNDGYRYKDGKKLELKLYYNSNNSQEKTISEFIQNDLKNIGVDLKIIGEEKQAFLDRQRNGDFDLQYSLSWGTPYDPQSYISSFRIPAHGDYQAQRGLEKKEWLDEEITALMIEGNKEKREKMYENILTFIHEECVYIPLTYARAKAVHTPKLKGVEFNPSQYEIPFEKMYFDN